LIEQQLGQRVRREVVDGERRLDAVYGLLAVGEHRADVVDQDREWPAGGDPRGQRSHLLEVGEVGRHECRWGRAGNGRDPLDRPGAASSPRSAHRRRSRTRAPQQIPHR